MVEPLRLAPVADISWEVGRHAVAGGLVQWPPRCLELRSHPFAATGVSDAAA